MADKRSQLLRFAASGVCGLAADVAVLYLALALGAGYYGGRVLSFLAAATLTWLLNRRFTFHATSSPLREWRRYIAAMLGGGLVNYAVYSLLINTMPQRPWLAALAVAAGSLAGMSFNFIAARRFVFHQR